MTVIESPKKLPGEDMTPEARRALLAGIERRRAQIRAEYHRIPAANRHEGNEMAMELTEEDNRLHAQAVRHRNALRAALRAAKERKRTYDAMCGRCFTVHAGECV